MIKTTRTQALFILGEESHCQSKLCRSVIKNAIEKTVARDLSLFEVLFMKEKERALVVKFLVLSQYCKPYWSVDMRVSSVRHGLKLKFQKFQRLKAKHIPLNYQRGKKRNW